MAACEVVNCNGIEIQCQVSFRTIYAPILFTGIEKFRRELRDSERGFLY